MSRPRVSIVVPAFEAAGYVGDAIASVRAQTFEDWELFVVDDGSADATAPAAQAAAEGDERVRVLTISHSGLPAVARNEGIRNATGDLLAFLDADDVWFPDKLARQVELFDQDQRLGLVHCAAERSDGSRPARSEVTFELLARAHNSIYTSSVAVRSEVIDRSGAFDEDPRLRGTEDFELWLRLVGRVRFGLVDEPLLRYTVRPGSVGSDAPVMAAGALVALDKAFRRDPTRFGELGSGYLTWLGAQRFRSGSGDLGRRELRAAVAADPKNIRAVVLLTLATLRLPRLKPLVRGLRGATGILTTRR